MSPAEARALENAVRVLQSEGQLDEADARALTDATAELAHLLWRMLLRLYQGKAHLALGFKSWGTYFEVEFGGRKTHGYELLAAGRVLEELEPPGFRSEGSSGSVLLNERSARELAPLLRNGGDAVREAWEEAVERHGPKPTAAQVRGVVKKRLSDQERNHGSSDKPAPSWVARMRTLVDELQFILIEALAPDAGACHAALGLLGDVTLDLRRLAGGDAGGDA
jgi:hypothetical protein